MNCKLKSMSMECIYIQPKYTADSAGMIKHSCLVLHAQILCLYLVCLFISCSLQSPLSLSFPLPLLLSPLSLFFMDAELSIESKTASLRIQIYVLQGKSSPEALCTYFVSLIQSEFK